MNDSALQPLKERAAYLLAEDELTDIQIAEQLGVSRMTLYRWKKEPEFSERVEAVRRDVVAEVRRRGIASVENRVKAQDDRWRRMQRVMAQRGAEEGMEAVPGGATGLLVRSYKSIGGEAVEVFEVDTGLLREMRELEELTARELGQREVKVQHRTEGPSPFDRAVAERLASDPDFASRADGLARLLAEQAESRDGSTLLGESTLGEPGPHEKRNADERR